MAAFAQSQAICTQNPQVLAFSGVSLKSSEQCLMGSRSINFAVRPTSSRLKSRRNFTVRAVYSERERSSSAGIFIGGFILGGLVVGALGCFYAPQISKAIAGADRKDLMRKLPKFIYDEEKALEKTRKVLTDKIAQLNSAIDEVSSQLRASDAPNGAPVASDEIEAAL